MNIVSLTSVFGMGTGVTKLLWLSQIYLKILVYKAFYMGNYCKFKGKLIRKTWFSYAEVPERSNGQDSRSCGLVPS